MKIRTKKQSQDARDAVGKTYSNTLILHELIARTFDSFEKEELTSEQKEYIEKVLHYSDNLRDSVENLRTVI